MWGWAKGFLPDYFAWTVLDQLLDSKWGRRFRKALGAMVLSAMGAVGAYWAALPDRVKYVSLGAMIAFGITAAVFGLAVLRERSVRVFAPSRSGVAKIETAPLRGIYFKCERHNVGMIEAQASKYNAIMAGKHGEEVPRFDVVVQLEGKFVNAAGHTLTLLAPPRIEVAERSSGGSWTHVAAPDNSYYAVISIDTPTGSKRLGELDGLGLAPGEASGRYQVQAHIPITLGQRRSLTRGQHGIRVTVDSALGDWSLCFADIDWNEVRELGHTTEHEPFF